MEAIPTRIAPTRPKFQTYITERRAEGRRRNPDYYAKNDHATIKTFASEGADFVDEDGRRYRISRAGDREIEMGSGLEKKGMPRRIGTTIKLDVCLPRKSKHMLPQVNMPLRLRSTLDSGVDYPITVIPTQSYIANARRATGYIYVSNLPENEIPSVPRPKLRNRKKKNISPKLTVK